MCLRVTLALGDESCVTGWPVTSLHLVLLPARNRNRYTLR